MSVTLTPEERAEIRELWAGTQPLDLKTVQDWCTKTGTSIKKIVKILTDRRSSSSEREIGSIDLKLSRLDRVGNVLREAQECTTREDYVESLEACRLEAQERIRIIVGGI